MTDKTFDVVVPKDLYDKYTGEVDHNPVAGLQNTITSLIKQGFPPTVYCCEHENMPVLKIDLNDVETKTLHLNIPEEIYEKAVAWCEKEGVTLEDVVRFDIQEYIHIDVAAQITKKARARARKGSETKFARTHGVVVKRPRLRMVDLATINDALDCYIESLKNQEATAKLDDPDKWIQAREKLHWKVLNAKNAQVKVVMNLKGAECGRTPKTLKHLLNLTAKDGMGEYIHFGEALGLMPDDLNAETVSMDLFNAMRSGVVDTSLLKEDGSELRKLRKLDVLRLAAYMEVHG